MNKNSSIISRRDFINKSGTLLAGATFLGTFVPLSMVSCQRTKLMAVKHVVVASEKGRFLAWPANNGIWNWDQGADILVGFTDGPFEEQSGHNIGLERYHRSGLARSTDGGKSWQVEHPENFLETGSIPQICPGNIHFGHPDFAMRVGATGYHGNDDPKGHFYYSYDRGKTWEGPWRFNELNADTQLQGIEITARTSYFVTGERSAQVILTARRPGIEWSDRLDKPFLAETNDGGSTFQFISWIVPWSDNNRAAMPSSVITQSGKMIVSARRRNPFDPTQIDWVDCFVSADNGRSWSFLSKVGETGFHNGNPPGLTILRDGRLACCYANRNRSEVLVRFSNDEGKSWGEETVLRDNPLDYDIGYPQIVENNKGQMVAIYYLATEEMPHSHIEAAIWQP